MGYASKQGRTRVDFRSPSASGQCDRCGFLYNFSHLRWQMDYSGAGIYNKRILVCEKCYDTPQQQLKVIVIPPDPLPVLNARPPDYVNAETDYRITSGQNTVDPVTGIPIVIGDYRVTQNSNNRVTQQTGEPPYGLNTLPGTNMDVPGNDDIGLPYGFTEVPSTGGLSPYPITVGWANNLNQPCYFNTPPDIWIDTVPVDWTETYNPGLGDT